MYLYTHKTVEKDIGPKIVLICCESAMFTPILNELYHSFQEKLPFKILHTVQFTISFCHFFLISNLLTMKRIKQMPP